MPYRIRMFGAVALSIGLAGALSIAPALSQQPQRGGIFKFAAEGDPPSLDCHVGTDVFAMQHLAPEYSTVLRYIPEKFPDIEGDLAESWNASSDGKTYTFKLRSGVKFHNGTALTSEDVKASFERIINPPNNMPSPRQSELSDVSAIETPDATTVVFKLKEQNPSFITSMANPWNCIYSAKMLKDDPDYPAKKVMGTGPFVFQEYVPGSAWRAKRNDNYFRKGLPYLDGIEMLRMDTNALVNSLAAGQIQGYFRQLTPPQRTQIANARGDKMKFQSVPAIGMNLVTYNIDKKPYDDQRVRLALSLAIDRYESARVMGRTSFAKIVGGLLRPGYPMAMTEKELEKMPGFSRDIEASRREARRLLKEAGQENMTIHLLNRNLQVPNIAFGIFLVDQWQRIGLKTEVETLPSANYFSRIRSGDFSISIDFNVPVSDDPTVVFVKFMPGSSTNYSHSDDKVQAELYEKQKRMTDPDARKKAVREMEEREIKQAYYAPLLWAERTIPLASEVHGFTVTPNNQVGQSFETMWISK